MEQADKIAESFLAPVGSAFPFPDIQIIEREGWYQTITPTSKTVVGNEVAYSKLGADAEAVLDRTIEEYRSRGLQFKWCVGPLTEPANFGALLEARGFSSYPVRGMAIDPGAWKPRSQIVVERVTSATLRDYYNGWSIGWELTVADDEAWIAAHERALATGWYHFFTARIDGEAVGTAACIEKKRSVYLIGGNVLAKFRGRGVYRALLDARLSRAAAKGYTLATTQAREATSAPILEKLGFETLFRSRVYKWEP